MALNTPLRSARVPAVTLSRRALLGGVAAVAGGTILAACGGRAPTPGATAAPPNATVAAPASAGSTTLALSYGTGAIGEALKAASKDFEAAHKGVTTTASIYTDATTYKSTGAQLFTSSDAPDVAWYWVEAQSSYKAMVRAKALVPLDDVWKANNLEAVLDPTTVKRYTEADGHHYAVPLDLTWYGMLIYNEALFAKAGITDMNRQPTWTQFLGWTDKLRAAGIEPLAAGGKQGSVLGWFYNIYLQRQMPPDKLEKLRNYAAADADTSVTYKDADNVAVFQQLKQFADKKIFAEGDLARSRDEAQGTFLQQRAAMYQVVSSDVAPAALPLPDGMKINWFMHPTTKDGVPLKFLVYDGAALMVPAKTKHADLAKEFVAFYTTKDHQEAVLKQFSLASSRNDMSDEARQALAPVLRETNDLRTKLGGSFPWASSNQGQIVNRTFQVIQEVLAGSRTPEDAANVQEGEAQKLRKGI